MLLETSKPTQGAKQRHEEATPAKAARDVSLWFRQQMARASKTGQFTEAARLSPALAEYLIANYMPPGSNRNLRPAKVAKLADVMQRGEWNPNTHQGIAFATDGTVNDGQHRINAVWQSGVTVTLPMTFGQPRAAFEVIDQDITPRTAGDLVQMADVGLSSYNNAAAAARLLLHIKSGASASDLRHATTKQGILNFCRENAEALNLAVNEGRRMAQGMRERVSPSNIASAMFLIRAGGANAAHMDAFVEALRTGADLKATSPLLILREGLRAGAFGGHLRGNQDRRIHEAAAVVKAWNLWRQGRTIKSKQALGYDVTSPFPAARP